MRAHLAIGLAAASLLAFATPAFGAEVSGRVLIDQQPFNGTLTLPDGTRVNVTNGQYKVFLPAGVHTVVFDNGRKFEATIKSSTIAVVQDINLDSQR